MKMNYLSYTNFSTFSLFCLTHPYHSVSLSHFHLYQICLKIISTAICGLLISPPKPHAFVSLPLQSSILLYYAQKI